MYIVNRICIRKYASVYDKHFTLLREWSQKHAIQNFFKTSAANRSSSSRSSVICSLALLVCSRSYFLSNCISTYSLYHCFTRGTQISSSKRLLFQPFSFCIHKEIHFHHLTNRSFNLFHFPCAYPWEGTSSHLECLFRMFPFVFFSQVYYILHSITSSFLADVYLFPPVG